MPATIKLTRSFYRVINGTIAAFLLSIVIYLQGAKYSQGTFGRWADIGSLMSDISVFSCLASAATGCYVVQRAYRRDSMLTSSPTRRSSAALLLKLSSPHFLVISVATFIGTLPLTVFVASTATAESYPLRNAVFLLFAMIFAYSIGVLFGMLLRSVLGVPLALAVVLCWFQLVNVIGDRSFTIVPLRTVVQLPGQTLSNWVSLFGVCMLLVLSFGLISLCYLVALRPLDWRPVFWAVSSFFVLVVFSVSLPLGGPPPLWDVNAEADRECKVVDLMGVCVHSAHRGQLANVVSEATPVLERLGPVPAPPPVLLDTTLLHRSHDLSDAVIVFSPGTEGTGGASSIMAEYYSGSVACFMESSAGEMEMSNIIFEWLETGYLRPEVSMSEVDLQAFVHDNYARIRSCSVDVSEVSYL